MRRGFLLGVASTILLLLVAAWVIVTFGLVPANADAVPPELEAWAAKRSLRATIARDAPKTDNPVPLTDANLVAGLKLYGEDCAVCHGGADGAPSVIARGFYQEPPQLAKEGVEDDPPGNTYWKIAHGIRFTAMPSFDHSLTEQQVWQITLFLVHMDKLPSSIEPMWRQAAPAPPSAAPPAP
jgi:thiosulfate dehydrogenase